MNGIDPTQLATLAAALDGLRSTVARALAEGPMPQAPTDPIEQLLVSARQSIMQNPTTSAGMVAALSRLGQDHAQTPAGAELLDRLVTSDEVARLRSLWEAVTLNVLDEIDDPSPVPAAWLDLVLDGLATDQLDAALDSMRPPGYA